MPSVSPQREAAQALERLERVLKESEGEWVKGRPFLDTSPLTRDPQQQDVEDQNRS